MTTTRFAPPRFQGMDSNDLHAWIELEDGKKMDYPPQEVFCSILLHCLPRLYGGLTYSSSFI